MALLCNKKRYDSILGAVKAAFHLNYQFEKLGRKRKIKSYYVCKKVQRLPPDKQ